MKKLLFLAPLLIACTKSKADSYEKVANLANPALSKLRPAALRIAALGATPEARPELIRLCSNMDPELRVLIDNVPAFSELDTEPGGPDFSVLAVPNTARLIVDGRAGVCNGGGDGQRCADFCLSRWNELAEAVEGINRGAAKAKVKLVELR